MDFSRIRSTIYADRHTPLDSLLPIFEKYKEMELHKVFFAMREKDYSKELNLWYKPINLDGIDLNKLKGKSLQDWLRE